jgi:hypothetical protein
MKELPPELPFADIRFLSLAALTSSEHSPLVYLLDHRNIPSMSDLIHLCPFTIRCSQRSKQIEALSACPGSLGLFCGFIFAIPAPRGGVRAVVDRYGNAELA